MPAFSLAPPPPQVTPKLHRWHDAPLPTQTQLPGCRDFGGVLKPRYIVGAESLDQ